MLSKASNILLWFVLLIFLLPPLGFAGRASDAADALPPLRVRVVDHGSGRALSGCKLTVTERSATSEHITTTTVTTDDSGRAVIPRRHRLLGGYSLLGSARGYVSQLYLWSTREGLLPPEAEYTVKLAAGIEAGGIVRSPAGKPVSGVSITITPGMWDQDGDVLLMQQAGAKTDDNGKWTTWITDSATARYKLHAVHPDYAEHWSTDEEVDLNRLKATTFETLLEAGYSIHGRVVDEKGNALANVAVRPYPMGTDLPPVQTDSSGKFELKNCRDGSMAILARAKDHAPAQLELIAQKGMQPVEISMGRGRQLTVRASDRNGAPVPNAGVSAHVWLKHIRHQCALNWQGETGKDGTIVWHNAPNVDVQWVIAASGYKPEQPESSAGAAEVTATLSRETRLKGTIKGRVSGRAPEECVVFDGEIRADGRTSWNSDTRVQRVRNGELDFRFNDDPTTRKVGIVSPRHMPVIFQPGTADGNDFTTNVLLDAGQPVVGSVIDADGKPATSATVVVRNEWSSVMAFNGDLKPLGPYDAIVTDKNGQFEVPPQVTTFTLAVVHDKGSAEQQYNAATTQTRLQLQPWGSIALSFPDANPGEVVNLRLNEKTMLMGLGVTSKVDAGKFVCVARARAGRWVGDACLLIKDPSESHRYTVYFKVDPGTTQTVVVGGGSTNIEGQVELPTSGGVVMRPSGDVVKLEPVLEPSDNYAKARVLTRALPDAEGRFCFTRVLHGNYQLSFGMHETAWTDERRIFAFGRTSVTVPPPNNTSTAAGTSSSVVDVGKLRMKRVRAAVGDVAPELVVKGSAGEQISLSSFRGKWVILDFWAETCAPCIRAMESELQPLWSKEKNANRLEILSLAITEDPHACEKIMRERGFGWRHSILGNEEEEACTVYNIRGYPTLYLVNPEGEIVASDHDTSKIRRIYEEAVAGAR